MEGLIYYNIGHKCLVKLAVSIATLKRYFKNDVTIISDKNCFKECKEIADHFQVNIKQDLSSEGGKNAAFLNKCRMHLLSPYDRTLFLDSDIIVLKDFSDAFKLLDDTEFIVPQFCNWRSDERQYRRRIKRWQGLIPDDIYAHAFDEKRAVNIGFYGWNKGARIFDKWYDTAMANRNSFIPDEIACQILLPQNPCKIISNQYNVSCKHEPLTPEAYTLHYHGRKHCRIQDGIYLYNCDLWYNEFDKIRGLECVKNNIQFDPMLRKYLHIHDKKKNG